MWTVRRIQTVCILFASAAEETLLLYKNRFVQETFLYLFYYLFLSNVFVIVVYALKDSSLSLSSMMHISITSHASVQQSSRVESVHIQQKSNQINFIYTALKSQSHCHRIVSLIHWWIPADSGEVRESALFESDAKWLETSLLTRSINLLSFQINTSTLDLSHLKPSSRSGGTTHSHYAFTYVHFCNVRPLKGQTQVSTSLPRLESRSTDALDAVAALNVTDIRRSFHKSASKRIWWFFFHL